MADNVKNFNKGFFKKWRKDIANLKKMRYSIYMNKNNNDIKIGNVKLKNRVFAAPMAGVSDLAFRRVCRKYGAALAYSEMISSKALFYNDRKTLEIIKTDEFDKPLAVQIFGSDEKIMAQTAYKALSTGADILDINMGCPAPKVVKCGDGSALLKDTSKIAKIVSEVKKAVNVPVTVKIRSGFDTVTAICIHPRTREMYYSGKADWSIIKDVKNAVKIPVIGNGDIQSPYDAEKMFDETNCDFIMVGRGAQGNPFIFGQILSYLETGEFREIPPSERLETLIWQLDMLIADKGEYIGSQEARKHVAWYTKGLKNSAEIRCKVNNSRSADELKNCITEYFSSL